MNLAHNAVQHTHEGDTIALGTELRDGDARIWVADTGPGIAAADRERIFERFARADAPPRRRRARPGDRHAIADAHGGRIELESRRARARASRSRFPSSPRGDHPP